MTADSRCAAGDRCAGYDHREGVAAERDGHPVLCEADLAAGERAVPLLVRDYAGLENWLPPKTGRRDGQPQGSAEPRSLIQLHVEAIQRNIWWVLTSWADTLRDRLRLSEPAASGLANPAAAQAPQLAPGVQVQYAAEILAPRVRVLAKVGLTTMAGYPNLDDDQMFRLGAIEYGTLPGWQGVLDFARLHRQAFAAQELTDPKPEACPGVVCKRCDYVTLFREPGDDWVVCKTCGLWYSAEDYQTWVGMKSAEQKVKQEA
jgi:hypothetical protein